MKEREEQRFSGPAKASAVTGRAFEAGDTVCSLLVDEGRAYSRIDLLAAEADGWSAGKKKILCRWKWTVKPRDAKAREDQKQNALQGEELFAALCAEAAPEEVATPEALAERETLRHLLALALQRRRILKADPARPGYYIHAQTKEAFHAPEPATLDPAVIRKAAEGLVVI
jgi:hypothetical protein